MSEKIFTVLRHGIYTFLNNKKDTLDTKVYLFYNQEKRERRELHEFHGQSYCSETS